MDGGNFRLAHWATMQARDDVASMLPTLRRPVTLTFGPRFWWAGMVPLINIARVSR